MRLLRHLLVEEEGQGLAEYSLIIALIALVVIASLQLFGDKLNVFYNYIKGEIGKVV